jgi:serine/threonine protein kinase
MNFLMMICCCPFSFHQPSYVAPEVLKNQPYDQSCDMWSVGVILYVILCGYTPFMEDSQEKMFERIKQGDWKFDEQDWGHISEEAKDLITAMLQIDIDSRISAADALKSRWIMKDAEFLASRDLSQSLQIIKEKRPRLKDLARAFMSMGVTTKNALKEINPIQLEVGEHRLT